MPARPVVSEAQWGILLQFMEENREMARGCLSNDGPMGRRRAAERWGQLAARLNSEGLGATKTPVQWRDWSCKILYVSLALSSEWPEPPEPSPTLQAVTEVDPPPPAPRPWTPPPPPATPPPQQLSPSCDSRRRTGTRRVYRRIVQPAPDWVVRLEERRLATDQQMADATAEIARALSLMASAMQELARTPARGRDDIS